MSARDLTIDDARGLLDAFNTNGWASAIVRVGDKEFAIARDADLGGLAAQTGETAAAPASAEATAAFVTVSAPHVGTVVELTEIGRSVVKGARVAVISVLGDTFDVPAPAEGRVTSHAAEPGALIEFGEALVQISA